MTTLKDILPPICMLKERQRVLDRCQDCAGYDKTCQSYLTKSMHDRISQRFYERGMQRIRDYNDSGVVG
jgi:hypothetical protein